MNPNHLYVSYRRPGKPLFEPNHPATYHIYAEDMTPDKTKRNPQLRGTGRGVALGTVTKLPIEQGGWYVWTCLTPFRIENHRENDREKMTAYIRERIIEHFYGPQEDASTPDGDPSADASLEDLFLKAVGLLNTTDDSPEAIAKLTAFGEVIHSHPAYKVLSGLAHCDATASNHLKRAYIDRARRFAKRATKEPS